MAAGLVTLTAKDGAGNSRSTQWWSSDGTVGGVLSPVQTLLGADGLNIASPANPLPPNGGTGQLYSQNPTVQASAYASGAVCGGKQALTLSGTRISSLSLISKSGLTVPMGFLFFGADPSNTTWTERTTFALSNSDVPNMLNAGSLILAPQTFAGQTQTAVSGGLDIPIQPDGLVWLIMYAGSSGVTPASTSEFFINIGVE